MKNQTYQPTELYDGYDGVGNAEAILQYMHELQNTGVHAALPDTVSYNTVIGAYTRVTKKVNKDAHIKAKKFLRDMINLRNNGNQLVAPDHRYYIHLISSWVKNNQPNSSERPYWWLHRIW